ncbi:MAG: DUF1343 domain-containing protein [Gammaproteobacteria bacterium]|nr:DUF1343 domain-containing protein [Gammaproteobacteria bacterium]
MNGAGARLGACLFAALLGVGLLAVMPGARAAGGAPMRSADLSAVASVVEAEIAAGRVPGAVVLVGQGERILYRKAFGRRDADASAPPMTVDTVFDLASLTKAVFTTVAVLQLAEQGRLDLDAPAARYWPAFGANGKQAITVRQLLAHTAGLPAGVDPGKAKDAAGLWRSVAEAKPLGPPGRDARYSDVGFLALGRIVEQVSGESLAAYADRHLRPALGWQDTGFLAAPTASRGDLARVAPSAAPDQSEAPVQDPLARVAGGAAGHAGLMGTADDLARFARTLLAGGGALLTPESVRLLFVPQTPPGVTPRGLGWRLEAPLAANRAALPALGAIGHLGYTGTGLWLDATRGLYVVVLSNRTRLRDGDAMPLRARVVAAVSESAGPLPARELATRHPEERGRVAPFVPKEVARPVRTGIDVLEDERFAPLRGKRVALLTHRSGVDGAGRRTIDALAAAPGVSLVSLFSPEHGLDSAQEGQVRDGRDPATNLPVRSLYGKSKRPAAEQLRGLDAVVVDLQDAGTRFYTYATTLAYLMEVAGQEGVAVYVLDRPNPLDAKTVQGPVLDAAQRGFTGYWPLPTRHGMTLGELARLFVGEAGIGVELHVVAMRHYRRDAFHEDTGLPWIPPSPNLASVDAAVLYPGVGMIEGAPVSVGRGTDTPFEIVGAPWIDGAALARALNALGLPGVRFAPTTFTPETATHAGKRCAGVRVEVADRGALDAPAVGLALAYALQRLHPQELQIDRILGNLGSREVLDAIRDGRPFADARALADRQAKAFLPVRARYLIY